MALTPNLILKTHDTYPPLVATLSDQNGPINLSTATSVEVVLVGQTTMTIITGATTVTDASAGIVSYTWMSGDTAIADTYLAEYMITWSAGVFQTVPNAAASNPVVEIDARLDGTIG